MDPNGKGEGVQCLLVATRLHAVYVPQTAATLLPLAAATGAWAGREVKKWHQLGPSEQLPYIHDPVGKTLFVVVNISGYETLLVKSC